MSQKQSQAIERVREFVGYDPSDSGELVVLDPALIDQDTPEGFVREGIATLDDVEGRHPSLPIKASLKEMAGRVVVVLAVDFTPTPEQFKSEKRAKGLDPEDYTGVFQFRSVEDGLYYVAVAGNGRVMREAETLSALLKRVAGVRCRVEAYQSVGGTGYHFASVGPRQVTA